MKSKIILSAVELIVFCCVLYFLIVNFLTKTTAGFNVTADGSGYIVLSTFFVLLLGYLLGLISGILYSFVLGARYKDQLEFYARKNEKLSQQNEIDSDEREALQRKIASLEIALDNALKNK